MKHTKKSNGLKDRVIVELFIAEPHNLGTEPHVCIQIENYATLFLWSKWLVAWITDVCPTKKNDDAAQHGGHRDQGIQQWFKVYILDIHVTVN